MALYPEQAERVYQEIKDVESSDINTLANLPCLNGFINESMRLIPAALTMGTRLTPPEGMTIDGTYIPGGIKVAAPRYTIFRSKFLDWKTGFRSHKSNPFTTILVESAFEDPLSFVPERWYSRPEMIREKSAFVPFGVGM
jgi:cytochrome P450